MKLLSILIFCTLLLSFSFTPMSQSIELGNKQKAAQFMVSNESDESVAIELTVKERKMAINGTEELPKTKDVTVFPPQMIIPAREKRTVRVNWISKEELKSERAFRVIAEQLPLKVDEKTKKRSGIQMLMRYMAALYVTPDGAKPDVRPLSHEVKNGDLLLTLENFGDRHRILIDPVLTIEDKGKKKIILKEKNLDGLAGENVLAKTKRTFTLKGLKDVTGAAEISLKIND
jgi:fimbrial chaperone protein